MRLLRSVSIVLTCTAILASGASWAQAQLPAAVQSFDAADQLYIDGHYLRAAAAYDSVLTTGYATGALYFNAGNAYYRIDQYGQARRYWEKARRHLGNIPALEHNIALLEANIGTPYSSVPPPFWMTWWEELVMPLGPMPFLVLGLMLYGIASALYLRHIWMPSASAWQRRLRVVSGLLGVLLLAVAVGVSATDARISRGVVIEGSATLADTLGALGVQGVPEGVVVSILERVGTHYLIRLPNGIEGYLPAHAVGEI